MTSGERILSSNRFDLLRLLFSVGIFVYHAWVLTGIAPFGPVEIALGTLGLLLIEGFFIISGALVYGSLLRTHSMDVYAIKRIRRVYPAYIVIILIPAAISLILTGGEALADIGKYVAANLVFLNFLVPDLPGLFEGQRFQEVNGPLWTLKVEVMFYIALPVIGFVMHRMGRASWIMLVLLYVGGEAWRLFIPHYFDHPYAPEVARQLPGQMAFFASGMALWTVWDVAKARPWMFGLAGAVLLAVSFAHPLLEPVRAAGLAGLIAWAAFVPGPALDVARFGDFSYGLYITHFPIIQAMIMVGAFSIMPFAAAFAVAAALSFLASVLLWFFVEKPALRRDSHYRKAAAGG